MRILKRIPKEGETRIRSGFLFFPRCIYASAFNGDLWRDIRWLCWASWEEECVRDERHGCCWIARKWVNEYE
jgi:hypothetical protein